MENFILFSLAMYMLFEDYFLPLYGLNYFVLIGNICMWMYFPEEQLMWSIKVPPRFKIIIAFIVIHILENTIIYWYY